METLHHVSHRVKYVYNNSRLKLQRHQYATCAGTKQVAYGLSGFWAAVACGHTAVLRRIVAVRSGCFRGDGGVLGQPPGKRRDLQADVRDRDRFPEGCLAHRSDGEDSL